MTFQLRIHSPLAGVCLIFLVLFSHIGLAQNAERLYKGHRVYDDSLEIQVSDGKIAITPYSEKIIEIQFLTELQPVNPPSYAVTKPPETVNAKVEESENTLVYQTDGIHLEVIKTPFQIKYYYRDSFLISDQLGYFEAEKHSGFKFNLNESEVIYGGGERALTMNRRGYALPLYNTPSYGYSDVREDMYFSIPLVISSKKYMILWDNAPKGILDIDKTEPGVLNFHSIGGRKVFYLLAGEDFYDLNTQYTDLTGRQPLPPRWTLGNIASRFGYHTQAEAEDTIGKYRQKSVPVDAIVIDLFWFGKDIKGHMGNLDWDYDAWPKPIKMMKNFRKQGVNTVLITEPFILKTSKRWQEAVDADILAKNYRGEPYIFDFYFGTSGLIDIFKPQAKTWFWNIYKKHTDSGVSAWWGDLGEPESHASDMLHVTGSADFVHNVYGHEWAKMVFDGYQKDYPNRRPFVLMRSGFAGSQRYAMVSWSGDVSRSWEGLQSQPVLTMQMGMQGIGYAHSDLGGFAPHYIEDKLFVDPMLYTRWLQYGVFQPIFRPHSHESSPAEPVFWDERTLKLTREAIDLRYQLFPYNYTLAYENASKGYPLMRPLFYDEPNNTKLYEYSDAYLWGDSIMVAPILYPEQQTQNVYFPQGSHWVNYYTGETYAGGSEATVDLVDDYIPTFIRADAFVPMIPKGLQTTKNYSTRELQVLYFADPAKATAHYTFYDDDGVTHGSITKNMHELIEFSADRDDSGFQFSIASNGGTFKGRPKSRNISLIIDHLTTLPSSVVIGELSLPLLDSPPRNKKTSYAQKLSDSKIEVMVVFKGGTVDIAF